MDYVALAQSRLSSQFTNSPKLQAFVAAMVGVFAELESSAEQLRTQRWIDTAVGVQLDGCGAIVGELRKGRGDDDYRKAILFRIFVNVSKGTPGDLIRGLKFLTDPTDCQYIESYPATAILFTDGPNVDKNVQPVIQSIAMAGVSVVPVAVSYLAKPFRFGRIAENAELFVNGNYLEADSSDVQVSVGGSRGQASLGAALPSDLDVGVGLLDVGGPTLALYNPDSLITLGNDHLTGVFQ